MENQQQLPTILSKAINLKRQTNLNTIKMNLPTMRRIWMPRDELEYHETNLSTTSQIWIPRYGFEYHETDLNTMSSSLYCPVLIYWVTSTDVKVYVTVQHVSCSYGSARHTEGIS